MKIIELLNSFPEKKRKQAIQFSVRELEEVKKNNFIAFVDDKAESYDVSIVVSRNTIIAHRCDCGIKEDYCLHKLAVIEELKNKIEKIPTKRRQKESETDVLLKAIDGEDLKNWLCNFFKLNKEAERHFILDFSKKTVAFTAKEVDTIIKDSIKSVIGNKRGKVSISEIKKILEILEKSLAPVLEYVEQHVVSVEKVDPIVLKIYNLLNEFHYKSSTTSIRIQNLIKDVVKKYAYSINRIEVEQQWEKIAFYYWGKLFDDSYLTNDSLEIAYQIYQFASKERKEQIANFLASNLKIFIKEDLKYNVEVNFYFLEIIIENHLLEDLLEYFTPVYYHNLYNEKLIDGLREIDEDKTIDYCKIIIEFNRNIKYNLPFYDVLLEIYEKQNKRDELVEIKMLLFPLAPTYDDYCFIRENMHDVEAYKKFRVKTLGRLRNLFYEFLEASEIYFKILNEEKNYVKMLAVCDERVPTSTILTYFDVLYQVNKGSFLKALLNRGRLISAEYEYEDVLRAKIIEYYELIDLKAYFNNPRNYSYNFTSNYILEKLVNNKS